MKRVLIAVILVLLGVGGVLFYYWQQATQLPSWYTEQATEQATDSPTEDASAQAMPSGEQSREGAGSPANRLTPRVPGQARIERSQETIQTKIDNSLRQSPDGKTVTLQLQDQELNDLFTSAVAKKAETSKLATAVKGVNTTVQNGKVETGAVINLSELQLNQLPGRERNALDKLVSAFPNLGNRSVYVGIEGRPTVKNGQIQLDESTRVRLGNLSFTPAELAQRLGVSEAQIRKQIELQLQLGQVKVNDLELKDDRAVIQGLVK